MTTTKNRFENKDNDEQNDDEDYDDFRFMMIHFFFYKCLMFVSKQ